LRPPLPSGPYLVVGLARSGVGAALALAARGAEVLGVDAGAPAGVERLAEAGVQLHLRSDGVALLERVRAVVKSPGVPARAPVIAGARQRGLPLLGELELAWRLLANEFIAVTGTNGKTTTVQLIGHIHREAGLPVTVAGNVGAALSGLVGKLEERVTIVCEASSFQLEDTIAFAPEAAVLLNLTPDHLDRHGTLDAYAAAKLELFARQGSEHLAVLPGALLEDAPRRGRETTGSGLLGGGSGIGIGIGIGLGSGSGGEDDVVVIPPIPGRARRVHFGSEPGAALLERAGELWWEGQPLLPASELRLRGRHNLENAMAAAAVCLARGVNREAVRAGLRSFAGVAHRLEEVGSRDGVLYVNDSKATNVASTLVALSSFAEIAGQARGGRSRPPVHLILGGQGKGQDFGALCDPVRRHCGAVYLIGADAPAIANALRDAGVPVQRCGELERALAAAASAAGAGEVVLLSPGCASFDQFEDFEARGERFRELVGLIGRRASA
jgi:UDP-N-acetylmuramoylalanine--D-glutamate ligase